MAIISFRQQAARSNINPLIAAARGQHLFAKQPKNAANLAMVVKRVNIVVFA